jgi:hypothetical protein
MNNNVNIIFTCHYCTLLNITLNLRLIIIRLFRYYRNLNEFGLCAVTKNYSIFTLNLYEKDCDIKSITVGKMKKKL